MGIHTIVSSKPRLLIILNRFVVGGQAADTIPLAWYLKEDFDVIVAYGEKEKDEIEPTFLLAQFPDLELIQIKSLRRSPNPIIDFIAFFNLLKIISKTKPHVVHTHGAKSGVLGRVAAWVARVPVIVHSFHGHFFHSYFNTFVSKCIIVVERIIAKLTTAVIVLSESQKAELCEKFKIIPPSKAHLVPLGVVFSPERQMGSPREDFRGRYSLQSSDVAIGIVGRIVAIKNHSFFVKVVASLLEEGARSAAFFVIGDGDRRSQVEDELKNEDIAFSNSKITQSSRVVFTSWITDIGEMMMGLDIIVLTSLNEGTPLSIIEAQYFQNPVVSTMAGGVKDAMVDGITGFITEQNDTTTFCRKLRLLIDNKELRSQMGAEGYKFVCEKFSKEKEVASTKVLYFSLLQQKGYSFINKAV